MLSKLLPLLLFAVVVLAQETPPAGATPPPADPTFVHEFGRPGAPGSFRVKFDARGAGIVWLQLMDHAATIAGARKEPAERTADDHLLLVWSGADYGMRLLPDLRSPQLGNTFGEAAWTVTRRDADAVEFTFDNGAGLLLAKTFRHRPAQRGFALELALRNTGVAVDDPHLHCTLLGTALVNASEATLFGNPAIGIAVAGDGKPVFHGPVAGGVRHELAVDVRTLQMAGSTNRFFAGFLCPLDDGAKAAVQRVALDSLPVVDDIEFHIKARSMPRPVYDLQLAVPQQQGENRAVFGLYFGPKSYHTFDEDPELLRYAPIMDVDLEPPCCGVSVPGGRMMASFLLRLLGWFHGVVGNWGIAIMMLTILVRGALAPLNFRMQKSMRAYGARMAVLKPKLDALKNQYADDPKGYQQAMIAFQRENKMIPPIGGCLPIFLTMPIYIGLFTSLRTAYDLRQQPFVGWMQDLSQPDALVHLGWGAWVPSLNLLPLLWLGLFVFQVMRQPLPTDPQQRQMQQMMRFMPIVFGVMLYNYASGLMVYMVTSMLWTFVESAMVKKILGPIDPNVQAMAPQPVM